MYTHSQMHFSTHVFSFALLSQIHIEIYIGTFTHIYKYTKPHILYPTLPSYHAYMYTYTHKYIYRNKCMYIYALMFIYVHIPV